MSFASSYAQIKNAQIPILNCVCVCGEGGGGVEGGVGIKNECLLII